VSLKIGRPAPCGNCIVAGRERLHVSSGSTHRQVGGQPHHTRPPPAPGGCVHSTAPAWVCEVWGACLDGGMHALRGAPPAISHGSRRPAAGRRGRPRLPSTARGPTDSAARRRAPSIARLTGSQRAGRCCLDSSRGAAAGNAVVLLHRAGGHSVKRQGRRQRASPPCLALPAGLSHGVWGPSAARGAPAGRTPHACTLRAAARVASPLRGARDLFCLCWGLDNTIDSTASPTPSRAQGAACKQANRAQGGGPARTWTHTAPHGAAGRLVKAPGAQAALPAPRRSWSPLCCSWPPPSSLWPPTVRTLRACGACSMIGKAPACMWRSPSETCRVVECPCMLRRQRPTPLPCTPFFFFLPACDDVDHCSSCSNDDINGWVCFGCEDAFYLATNSSGATTCRPCAEGCSDCTTSKSCTKCKQGYAMSPTNTTCNPCPVSCEECGYAPSGALKCTSCPPRQLLVAPTGLCTGNGTCEHRGRAGATKGQAAPLRCMGD
jgi:hypothetical protein